MNTDTRDAAVDPTDAKLAAIAEARAHLAAFRDAAARAGFTDVPYTNLDTRLPEHAAKFDAMLADFAANTTAQRPRIALGDEVTVLVGQRDPTRKTARLTGVGPKNIRVDGYTFTRASGTPPGEGSAAWYRLDKNDLARINRDLPARKGA